ncbi:MAG TPA: apolipoprotein N-acyltransferase [Dermatophilaceae bacterium]|nr:apolipoprotein N-acyltransferase [Dermatophilaceae bacterium]
MPLRLLLALLGGLGVWASFPSLGLWPLASVGVGMLALATAGAGAWRGGVLGFSFGMASFAPLLSWSGVYLGSVPWLALTTLQSLYLAGLGAVCGWLQPLRVGRPGSPGTMQRWDHPFWREVARLRVRPVVVTLAWITQELARSHTPFGGFPWARLAFSQADAPTVRLAALAGAPGVSAVVALTGAGLAAATLGWAQHRRRSALGWAAAALALVAGPLLIQPPTDGPTAQILAIQGNVPQAGLDFNAQRRAVLDNHAELTTAAAAWIRSGQLERPDLVIWPENASDIDPYRNPDAERTITAAVDAVGAPILLGAVLSEPVAGNTNASLLYTPGVGITDRYDKRHPVPFAEYIPWRPFFRFFSTQVDLVERDFVAGSRVGLMRISRPDGPPLAVGVNICFEVAGDDLVADGVNAGATLIVVQTNNATFGYTDEAAQQLAISRFRAVEHARSVVHVSTVGLSALITPDGVAHQTTSLFTAATLSRQLPVRNQLTAAAILGGWPATVAAAGLLVCALRRVNSLRVEGGRRRTRSAVE